MENFVDLGITPGWIIGFSITAAFLLLGGLFLVLYFTRYKRALHAYNTQRAIGDAAYKKERAAFVKEYRASHGGVKPEYYEGPRRDNYAGGQDREPRQDDYYGWAFGAIVAGGIGLLMLIVQLIMLIPYDSKYQSQFEVTGTVESAQGTLDTGTKYVTSEFLVKLDTTDIPLYMSDVRIQDLVGEKVSLICGVSWNDFGRAADSWSCDIRTADYTE